MSLLGQANPVAHQTYGFGQIVRGIRLDGSRRDLYRLHPQQPA